MWRKSHKQAWADQGPRRDSPSTSRILTATTAQQYWRPQLVNASKAFAPPIVVRTRRAYFDCRFGQLHVRTAFPTTGGFDEQVTLICLHPIDGSSRTFGRLLPELADVRSAYAPDLPGYGESDPSPTRSMAEAAEAVSDLANDLRLRQIDLLGIQYGAGVALELAAARPELVRKLVLTGVPAAERSNPVKQQRLIINSADYGDDFNAAAQTLAGQISVFLRGHASA
jgi:pimeloyl-ACP methyl ester carboxylesterase